MVFLCSGFRSSLSHFFFFFFFFVCLFHHSDFGYMCFTVCFIDEVDDPICEPDIYL